MTVTDADQEHLVRLIVQDLHAAIGRGYDHLALENAVRLRTFVHDLGSYVERVVGDTQQAVHDEFIDTAWPRCPRHHRHPLWFHDGGWWCEQDAVRVASLGELPAA